MISIGPIAAATFPSGRDLQARIDTAFPDRPDALGDRPAEPGPPSPARRARPAEPGPLRQGHIRDQSGPRHEIRIVERYVRPRRAMQQSRLRGVLSN